MPEEIIARKQYDPRPVVESDLDFTGDPGLTKQSDAKDSDINNILKKWEKTGALPDMIVREPRYGDFSNVTDYQEALHIVRHAEEQFISLDAHIRNRFDNDPAKFLEFVQDPKNEDEMENLGLLKPEAVERRQLARMKKDEEVRLAAAKEKEESEKALIEKVKKAINK